MKNVIQVLAVLFVTLFSTTFSFAQTWETFKIDKHVSVKSPVPLKEQPRDPGSKTYMAPTDDGMIMVMKMKLPKDAKSTEIRINIKTTTTVTTETSAEENAIPKFGDDEEEASTEEVTVSEEDSEAQTETEVILIDGIEAQRTINRMAFGDDKYMWQETAMVVHNNTVYVFGFIHNPTYKEFEKSNESDKFYRNITVKQKKRRKAR